jgi:SOS response regulatory protein OraA/RecX
MKIEWKEEKQRIFLFLDGEHVRTVSSRIVSSRELSGISDVTWDAFERSLSLLEQKGGMRLAYSSLARKSCHSQQIRELLSKHFLSEQVIENIVSFCHEKGYLNDQEWEAARIANLRTRGKSSKDIAFRLRKQGIASSFTRDDQEVLEKLIQKKYPALLQEDIPFKEKAKYIQALLRRGFSLQDIQKFLSDVYTDLE